MNIVQYRTSMLLSASQEWYVLGPRVRPFSSQAQCKCRALRGDRHQRGSTPGEYTCEWCTSHSGITHARYVGSAVFSQHGCPLFQWYLKFVSASRPLHLVVMPWLWLDSDLTEPCSGKQLIRSGQQQLVERMRCIGHVRTPSLMLEQFVCLCGCKW